MVRCINFPFIVLMMLMNLSISGVDGNLVVDRTICEGRNITLKCTINPFTNAKWSRNGSTTLPTCGNSGFCTTYIMTIDGVRYSFSGDLTGTSVFFQVEDVEDGIEWTCSKSTLIYEYTFYVPDECYFPCVGCWKAYLLMIMCSDFLPIVKILIILCLWKYIYCKRKHSTAQPGSDGSPKKPDSGGSPKKPDSGGSLKKPDSGGSPKKPDSGVSTTDGSDSGGSPKQPDSGVSTTDGSDSGGSPKQPDSGVSAANGSDSGDSPKKPDSGGSPKQPDSGGSPKQPDSGGSPKQLDSGGSPKKSDSGGWKLLLIVICVVVDLVVGVLGGAITGKYRSTDGFCVGEEVIIIIVLVSFIVFSLPEMALIYFLMIKRTGDKKDSRLCDNRLCTSVVSPGSKEPANVMTTTAKTDQYSRNR